LQKTLNGTSNTLDVSNFTNGIYFIAVEKNGAQISYQKVIVQH
jgi:hypothetical protein